MKNFYLKPKFFSTVKNYSKDQFVKDIVAGVIVAIIALPLSIALALASGVEPACGVYTAIFAGFMVSFLGGSRVQIAGPTAAFATVVAGIVATQGMEGLIIATILAGVFLILMGVFSVSVFATEDNTLRFDENGEFKERSQLKKVPKLGAKAFEQCAGFLRVSGSSEILDNTGVHPESYPIAEIIRISLGQIGVIIFFITSGYFYKRKPNDNKTFWKKKIRNLIIPWLLFSTIVFTLSEFVFGDPDNIFVDFFKNFFGIGTVYWYMTIITVLMLFFYRIADNDKLLYMCIGITIISFLLSALGVIKYTTNCNQYLNVFNWVGFFAVGILMRKKALFEKIINKRILLVSFVALVVFIIIAVEREIGIKAYIDITSIFVECIRF